MGAHTCEFEKAVGHSSGCIGWVLREHVAQAWRSTRTSERMRSIAHEEGGGVSSCGPAPHAYARLAGARGRCHHLQPAAGLSRGGGRS